MTKARLRKFTGLTLTSLLLASASLCQAQSPIVYNFTNSLEGWAGNGDNATYSWSATNGSTGGGCMVIAIDGTTSTEMDPVVNLASALNQAQYLSVSIHMKIDANSGTTGGGSYGNLQAVFRDAGGSWDSIWHGAVNPPAANAWVTYTFVISQPYHPAEKQLQFQFSSGGISGPLTNYIDNITITPVPNPWIVDAFTNDTSSGYSEEGWTGTSETSSLNTSRDAGGGLTPLGALQMDIAFPIAAQWAAWGQSWVARGQVTDPSRYSYFECDLKVDAANSTTMSDGSYGSLVIALRDGPSWHGPYACAPGTISLNSSYTSWKHLKLAIPAGDGGNPITNSPAYDIELSGNYMGPIRLYFDNIKLSNPVTHPVIAGLMPGTPGGIKISVDADGTNNQYDQEGISTASADNNATDFLWINQSPATYSFSLTNFPSPTVAPGFDAHVYLVNGDSLAALWNGSWPYNQTYSGVPYNAPDYAGLRVQNGTNGGVAVNFEWKTNAPNSNPSTNNITHFALPSYTSADGTWTLTFSDNIHVSITGPQGPVGSVTLPDFYTDLNYTGNFTPATSMVQFGLAKNDLNNTGINNNQSAYFTHVLVTNAVRSTYYDDSFGGPGLTANYAWQVAEYYQDAANRVLWQPSGTAWWLQWGLPATGYTVQSASSLAGPWNDAGVTYTYTDITGTNIYGAIPSVSLPAGPHAFFQLINTNTP